MLKISRIKEQNLEEAAQVAGLEKEIFPDAWSLQAVQDTLRQPQAMVYGAWEKGELRGYVICYCVPEEGEIARIAVAPSFRRQGIAGAVLKVLAYFCMQKGVKKLLLDVRESNAAALAFYRKNGFKEDGIRKNFYTNPEENAILMSRKLDESWKC